MGTFSKVNYPQYSEEELKDNWEQELPESNKEEKSEEEEK